MLILIYLTFEAKKAQKSNYVFEADDETLKVLEQADQLEKDGKLPNVILAVLPIICVAVVLNVLKQDISVALLSGIVLCLILCYKNVTGLRELLADSVTSAAQTTINASAIVAIGSVVKVAPGFKMYQAGRVFGHTTVYPGSAIGYHVHQNESETYYILSGTARYNDNGTMCTVTAGDVTFTGAGEGHGIEAIGKEPVEMIALILYDKRV